MDVIISNQSGVPIYEQIARQIKDAILSEELHEGEALPSIRVLAREARVSVITTKRAYEELEREGFVTTVPGKGCFVCGIPEGNPQEELRLLRQFDDAARNLLRRGYTRQELTRRLEQEDNHA